MLLLLATIFFQKRRLFSKTWTPTKTPTCLLRVVRAFSFQFSIFLSRSIILDSKKKRKRNPVSLRVSVVVVRVFFAQREESRRHRYTRVFQNRAVSARIIEGREESFATKPLFSEHARLFYAYFCSHSNAREREKRPFSSSNLLIKKYTVKYQGDFASESFATKPLFSERARLFYAYFCSHSNSRERELFLLRISS